jgi:small-conductance mechanosensitive channel
MRVGDFIEIDGVAGTVTNIGIRSTMVRTNANAATIIPNTALIEKNLTNWSYSPTVSELVRIGVAYGTDLKLLDQVVKEAAKSVEGLQKGLEPTLIFQDFGDNALILDIAYDIPSHQYINRRRIQSDLRFKLNDLFNEQGISVPFPQRDIHIVDGAPGVLQSRNDV